MRGGCFVIHSHLFALAHPISLHPDALSCGKPRAVFASGWRCTFALVGLASWSLICPFVPSGSFGSEVGFEVSGGFLVSMPRFAFALSQLAGLEAFDSGYLVDPASSHMLVSKIKPCMSKYKRLVL